MITFITINKMTHDKTYVKIYKLFIKYTLMELKEEEYLEGDMVSTKQEKKIRLETAVNRWNELDENAIIQYGEDVGIKQ